VLLQSIIADMPVVVAANTLLDRAKRMEVEDVGPPRRAADLSDDELAAIIAGAKLTVV
jgi:hypothetical protein